MKREIEITSDGSRTLYVPGLDEHYHSIKGALAESRHIFIDMGLNHHSSSQLHILEIGFGTGLNAFLTLLAAEEMVKKVHYTGIELYPLEMDVLRELAYPDTINIERSEDYYRLHQAEWDKDETITPAFTLHKIKGDFMKYEFPKEFFDIIYFDAFAPEKQPEMWSQCLFDALYRSLNIGGILTTYCAKGVVRRMLQSSGFEVERLPGPPGGKREILRGIKRK